MKTCGKFSVSGGFLDQPTQQTWLCWARKTTAATIRAELQNHSFWMEWQDNTSKHENVHSAPHNPLRIGKLQQTRSKLVLQLDHH
jgi:hypothetical protein